jgi:hypothetical protein
MRLREHVIASTVVAGGLYAMNRSLPMAAGVFVGGVLVDMDHFIDYWREQGMRFDPHHFMDVCNHYQLRQIYLILHSYELLLPFGIFAVLLHSAFFWGALAGYVVHMLMDQTGNGAGPWSYFFIYRWKKGFYHNRIVTIPGSRNEL